MKMERNYSAFLQDIGRFIPRDRLFTDELHRLAWGTDAGFYRLIPQIVIHSINDDEVIEIIYLADRTIYRLLSVQQEPAFRAKPLVTLF